MRSELQAFDRRLFDPTPVRGAVGKRGALAIIMTPLRHTLALLAATISLHADTIDIGGRLIDMPAPSGFVKVTADMVEVNRLFDQFTDPINDTLAIYIPESSVPDALSGEMPELDRYLWIKVNRALKANTVSIAAFAEMQASMALQNKKVIDEVIKKMPDYFGLINGNIEKEFGTKLSLGVSQVIPLEPHHKSENAFSYSMYANIKGVAEARQSSFVRPTTVTLLNVSGRIVFLYAYGAKDDLQWTRNCSLSWQTAILSRNPAPPKKISKTGIDWELVGGKAFAGAVCGGLVALIGGIASLIKKRRPD